MIRCPRIRQRARFRRVGRIQGSTLRDSRVVRAEFERDEARLRRRGAKRA